MSDLKPTDKISHSRIVVKYDGKTFGPYSNPQGALTIEIVQRELAKQFPEAAKCEIGQRVLADGDLELTFTKKAGTKGGGPGLAVGYYTPTTKFLQIPEHTAVMDAETRGLVAVTGPAHDPESHAYAQLFAAAPELLEAATFAVKVIKQNQPVELSEFIAIDKLKRAIKAAQSNAGEGGNNEIHP